MYSLLILNVEFVFQVKEYGVRQLRTSLLAQNLLHHLQLVLSHQVQTKLML